MEATKDTPNVESPDPAPPETQAPALPAKTAKLIKAMVIFLLLLIFYLSFNCGHQAVING